jgi:transcriptional regulator GlxA family with amidase domain
MALSLEVTTEPPPDISERSTISLRTRALARWGADAGYGRSPYQYILSERISVAKEMLSKSDQSIADVALAVGFSDASQLNRVFLKLLGVTPTAFRRENGLR